MDKSLRRAILFGILVLGTCAAAQTSSDYDPRRDVLYRRYLGATVLGVVGGIVGLFLIYRQGAIAARTADALANIERGWLLVSSIDPVAVETPPNESAQACTFVCHLQNFGKTPVKVIETAFRFHTIRDIDALPDDPFYGKSEYVQGDWFLAPGESTTVMAYLESRQVLPVLDRKATAAQGKLHALGMVKYEDAFGRHCETRFSYVHDLSRRENSGNGYFRRIGSRNYNRHT